MVAVTGLYCQVTWFLCWYKMNKWTGKHGPSVTMATAAESVTMVTATGSVTMGTVAESETVPMAEQSDTENS